MATVSPTKKLMKTPTPAAAAAAPVQAVAPAPAKTVVKSKAATVVKAKPAAAVLEAVEIVEQAETGDVIVRVAHEIENLKADKAFKMVPTLLDNIDRDYFRLGGVLAKVQSEGWFMEKQHETFRAFVEADCGIAYRKAMYLIQIYNGLVESGVAWELVGHLGWTKLKELAPILTTDNVIEWVAVAEGMTVLQLQEHIKASSKGVDSGNSPDAGASDAKATTTMTFKLHEDQKTTVRDALDKAKHESATDVDSVALEYIAMDYLGSSKLKAVTTLKELMEGKSVEEVLQVFEEVFPTVVLQAAVYDTVEEAQAAQAAAEAEAEADGVVG